MKLNIFVALTKGISQEQAVLRNPIIFWLVT
jgi:hypothetical protein